MMAALGGGDGVRAFVRQRLEQQGEMFASTHATKPLFDLEPRCGAPALFLITGPPMIDALRFPFDLRHDALDQIGRRQTSSQVLVNAEAMPRERFCEALIQTVGCRFIEAGQLLPSWRACCASA